MTMFPPLTLGDAASRLGCRPWQIRRLFERGLLSEPARVGAYRVIPEHDLPTIRAALIAAGYLSGAEVAPPTIATASSPAGHRRHGRSGGGA
jgi:hypothetical protein